MKTYEKGIMDMMMEDGVLSKKYTYDEFHTQNDAAETNEDELIEEAFNAYLDTCE